LGYSLDHRSIYGFPLTTRVTLNGRLGGRAQDWMGFFDDDASMTYTFLKKDIARQFVEALAPAERFDEDTPPRRPNAGVGDCPGDA
jgi:hypothetical protein